VRNEVKPFFDAAETTDCEADRVKLQHNLGGVENLGPVSTETRPFVEEWEKRIFGIHVAMMALSNHLSDALPRYALGQVPTRFHDMWTWGHLRMGAEAMNPFDYFKFRYYEKWLGGISGFFVERGYISQAELDQLSAQYLGGSLPTAAAKPSPAIDDQVIKYLREGDSPKRQGAPPSFAIGAKVRVKNVHPVEHTRLPGYLRGKLGTVDVIYEGAYAYFFSTGPDGIGAPLPVYCVKFAPTEIWGALAEPNAFIYADLFEAYLEPGDAS
jgi:nitrile hydratase